MKKTTYMIIALLVVILLGEITFFVALKSTGRPYREYLAEQGFVIEETEDGGYSVSLPDTETDTIGCEQPVYIIQVIMPQELKDELGINDGPLDLDTLVIPNPGHNIIIH